MAQLHVLMGADTVRVRPTVRRIGLADLKDALARGLADFSAIPTHAVAGAASRVSTFPGKTPLTCCTRRRATPLPRWAFCCW